jgi:SPP1 gp7 family putative phage head morphogenesis protein
VVNTSGRAGLKAALFAKRKKMGRAARRKHHKSTRWLYPGGTERRYAKAIRSWLKPLQDYVTQYLKNNQEAILRGDSESLIKQDETPGGTYRRMVKSLYGWHSTYLPPINESGTRDSTPIVFMGLGNIAESVTVFNSEQWNKTARAELGVEFPVYESWWPETKILWQEENYRLISSMGEDYIKRVNLATERAVTSGLSVSQLTRQIQKINKKITSSSANLIARDQIGKLNGKVTQARMEAVGLAMYEWSTAGDERVRDSHSDLEGMICKWDDPKVYSDDDGKTWRNRPSNWCQLHPGEDIQCRCTALSFFDELVNEVDHEIDLQEGFIAGSDDTPYSKNNETIEKEDKPERGLRTPLIESQLGITQETPAGWISAKRDSNANFDVKSPGYTSNCQRSIVAYELQRRGYRVTAMAAPWNRGNDPVKNGFECFLMKNKKRQMERAPKGRSQLESRLLQFGEGSRFAIFQTFSDNRSKYGHIYIAERIGTGIKYIDPQKNISGATVERYLSRVRVNNNQQELLFFRVDNAFLNPSIDFTKVVTPYKAKGNIDRADSSAIVYNEDRKMTEDEARAILEKSELIAPWASDQGEIWSYQIGNLFGETADCFSFIIYPHSTKTPLDKDYAFLFYVIKKTLEVIRSDSPFTENELNELGGK